MSANIETITVKTLDDEVISLAEVVDGQPTVIAFLRHFG